MQVTHFLLIHCFGSKQLLISNKVHQLQYDKVFNNIALGCEVHTYYNRLKRQNIVKLYAAALKSQS